MSLGKRPVLLLQLREQAHVLDRDHRLVGKGLKEHDLLVAEGTHFASADKDRANGNALTQEGSAERRAPPEPAGQISAGGKIVSLGQIFDVDNPRLAYRISRHEAMHRS